MNRRHFLLSVPPALALPAPRLAAVVYDTHHQAARAFAARMAHSGTATFATTGNALTLWYGDLGDLASQHSARVAGLTTYADLVIARAWGRDHGMRLAHAVTPAAPLFRWLLQGR